MFKFLLTVWLFFFIIGVFGVLVNSTPVFLGALFLWLAMIPLLFWLWIARMAVRGTTRLVKNELERK